MVSLDEDATERQIPEQDSAEGLERVRIEIRRKGGRRLDKYLTERFPRLSRTGVQRMIKQGEVSVNEKPTKASYEISAGDVIDVMLPVREPLEIVPQDIPIKVVYEDEAIIAVNKDAGIVCHPAHAEQSGTLVNALAFYASQLSAGSDPFRPGIVHRLDKYTTGVMLVAKTDEAHWRLGRQFENRTIQKCYLAVVEGSPELDSDVIDAPIGVHPVVREKFAVLIANNKVNVTKSATTYYEVAERFDGYTLMKLFPKTGRTHQLRVHMSYLGHPIVGDTMYGGQAVSEASLSGTGSDAPIFTNQALHAWKINFRHPITEQRLELEAEFHPPLRKLMNVLRRARSKDA